MLTKCGECHVKYSFYEKHPFKIKSLSEKRKKSTKAFSMVPEAVPTIASLPSTGCIARHRGGWKWCLGFGRNVRSKPRHRCHEPSQRPRTHRELRQAKMSGCVARRMEGLYGSYNASDKSSPRLRLRKQTDGTTNGHANADT